MLAALTPGMPAQDTSEQCPHARRAAVADYHFVSRIETMGHELTAMSCTDLSVPA